MADIDFSMSAMKVHPFLYSLLFLLLLASEISWSCDIPVFRYAMQNWPSDDYILSIPQSPGPDFASYLENLVRSEGERPNCRFEESASSDQTAQGTGGAPANMLVFLPRHTSRTDPIWSGPSETRSLSAVLDSPVRKEIARRLLSGESAVWLYLSAAVENPGQVTIDFLESELTRMEQDLELPAASSPQDSPPGRPRFSVIALSRSDPSEEFLIKCLLASEPDLDTPEFAHQPLVFPIFGQGRILYALVGAGITPQNIEEACQFLVGPCSCQVKELNPGFDLLLTADWLKAADKGEGMTPLAPVIRVETPRITETNSAARNTLLTLIVLTAVVSAGSLIVLRRSKA